jgi:hypothetical protein
MKELKKNVSPVTVAALSEACRALVVMARQSGFRSASRQVLKPIRETKKLRGFRPRTNYTNPATAACRRS